MTSALETVHDGNRALYEMLTEVCASNSEYRAYLENLFSSLLNSKCSGIKQKASEVKTIPKFDSFLSELEIAVRLVDRGKTVEFLPDAFMGSLPSPDLRATDSLRSYVEVKKLTEESSSKIMLEGLESHLKDKRFIVNVTLSKALSIPVLRIQQRQMKEELARKSLMEFKRRFSIANLDTLPIEIETEGVVFQIVGKTERDHGFPGLIRGQFVTVPDESYVCKIRADVKEKAEKRVNWRPEDKSLYYVVALDVRDHKAIDVDIVRQALYGESESFVPPLKPPSFTPTREIEEAIKKGWRDLMIQQGVLPHSETSPVRGKEGIFVTDKIVKNVSAVLILSIRGLQIFPNPFAYDEINDTAIANWIS